MTANPEQSYALEQSNVSNQPSEVMQWQASWQANAPIRQAIIDSVVAGEVAALNRMTPDRPATYRGTTAFYESWQFLIDRLRPYGFEKEEFHNQMRLVVPQGLSQHPARLLLCRGRREGGQIEVNPKGSLTRVLINQQNAQFGPQQVMDIDVMGPDHGLIHQNFWIVSEVKRTALTIYLTLPYWINETGTTIESMDAVELYVVDLNTVPYSPSDMPDVPQSQPIEVILGNIDGAGG